MNLGNYSKSMRLISFRFRDIYGPSFLQKYIGDKMSNFFEQVEKELTKKVKISEENIVFDQIDSIGYTIKANKAMTKDTNEAIKSLSKLDLESGTYQSKSNRAALEEQIQLANGFIDKIQSCAKDLIRYSEKLRKEINEVKANIPELDA